MDKIGLILEGGANRGIFTAGVLDFFRKKNIYLPYVLSVSVGSCNAMDYVSKQLGRTRDCMIPNGRNTPPICLRNLIKKKTMVNLDLVFDEYPNRIVPFDYEAYWASDIISEYVVTNCITGKAEYKSEKQDAKKLMEICRASSSMPYLSPMVYLDGVPYLDGGLSDPVPIQHAMELGYEKNIVVLTREEGYTKKDSRVLNSINPILYSKYPNLNKRLGDRGKQYNKTMELLDRLEKEKKALVIRPSKVLIGRLGNNKKRMNAFYWQGYKNAKSRMEEIRDFIR